ncbi:GAF domain-containing sensor histidine kinase [Aquimarina sp. MMG016]|uniref:GAF domain-containing sensor histidine kinase n=1 Tax=Aquimarina sp. MMG016 TaxID=2822690 RepID=UPI001B3A7040|nr:GAF domain-containing sensor histidine kinase [Aquimarina sp. MMG016]MBQ4820530.1 GAF domain-containing sensor histidine kinase [Aquimarina sp. MMG016]
MTPPKLPHNEKQRQKAVEKYQLLDTLPEESYDNITSLMSYICDTPISLITLLDKERNFLKSHHGVPFNESPREISFCGHAINSEAELTIIEDSRKDERFIGNPLVTDHDAIFYAGAPLVDVEGFKLGTLCVYDRQPRSLSVEQKNALLAMAKQVVNLFEQRYQNLKLLQLQDKLKKRNDDLKKFAGIVSHDLKSPLANIISLTELLEDDNKDLLNDESLQYLEYLKTSSYSLKDYIDGILKFYKSDELFSHRKEKINLVKLLQEIENITNTDHNVTFNIQNNCQELILNKAALMQILINLVTNGIKYNSKPNPLINIGVTESEDFYNFSVNDNGDGIPKEYLDKIFDLFSVVGVADRDGNVGTGIGLATVKKIVTNLGGEIKVSSSSGEGSTFSFSIVKN